MTKKKDKKPRVVVGVLAKRKNKYLLVKEKLEGGQEWWIVPGGGVEWGESIEDAIKRELQEETKLVTKSVKHLGVKEAIATEHDYHSVIFFYEAEVHDGAVELEEKIIESGWFTVEEAKELKLVFSAEWLFKESGLI